MIGVYRLYMVDDEVPAAPRSVRVINATSTSFYVTWSPATPSRGPLVAYRVAYWKESTSLLDAVSGTVLVNDVTVPGTLIAGLAPYSRYHLRV